ncbi:hypothetical protein BJY01DRAFT_113905 [Aspergillus pseudoustus]|uniref:Uncharacterized protein n=1 Tax=Aspergillus pseudoustus TaxID=1810923 RepID=A0ABR4KZP8_9EURO
MNGRLSAWRWFHFHLYLFQNGVGLAPTLILMHAWMDGISHHPRNASAGLNRDGNVAATVCLAGIYISLLCCSKCLARDDIGIGMNCFHTF